jgi:hypothetical protein
MEGFTIATSKVKGYSDYDFGAGFHNLTLLMHDRAMIVLEN